MASIQVIEYEDLTTGREDSKLSTEQFAYLKSFVDSNSDDETSTVVMSHSVKRGKGEVVTAKNYVGVIALNDTEKTQIEILPKICKSGTGGFDYETSKKVLLDMLNTVLDMQGNSINNSPNMEAARLPLYEIFVRMFLDATFEIFKRGLKRDYSTVSGNEAFLRGKLVVSRHIKENFAHAERFFVEYDEFNENQAENRLLKTTLLFLETKSRDPRNRQDIRVLLDQMDEVDCSSDVDGDFKKASIDERNNEYYRLALSWSSIFLRGDSFAPFAGSEYATAVLFPMDKLYESYVATKLRNKLPRGYTVEVQHEYFYLFDSVNDSPRNLFSLRPDVVISKGGFTVILDTKWKMLSYKTNYGISQDDMYQMYAYFREYQAHKDDTQNDVKKVIVLYPWTSDLMENDLKKGFLFKNGASGGNELIVEIKFLNLASEDGFKAILDDIENGLRAA